MKSYPIALLALIALATAISGFAPNGWGLLRDTLVHFILSFR